MKTSGYKQSQGDSTSIIKHPTSGVETIFLVYL